MTPDQDSTDKVTQSADETLPTRPKFLTPDETKPSRRSEKVTEDSQPVAPPPMISPSAPTKPIQFESKVVVSPEPPPPPVAPPAADKTPWTLQQFFNGEIDLDVELVKRFPNMPVMSTIHFRTLGTRTGRGVATLSTGDGNATVVFDADAATRVVQMSFTYGSMLTLRFILDDLSDMDRTRWLELMRRDQGGLAFLWSPKRWEQDYLICIARKYFTNFYAFSPNSFEASIRMTPDVTKKLLNWLEEFWKAPPPDQEPPKLLTW